MGLFTRKKIYLDAASAEPMGRDVLRYMQSIQKDTAANPSGLCSVHQKSRMMLESARKNIATYIAAQSRQIVFTHSGTESNVLAIVGVLSGLYQQGKRNMHVITTVVEHSSIHHVLQHYEAIYSFTTHQVPLENGIVALKPLQEMLTKLGPVLVSVQYVNSETGIVQNIREIAKAIRHAKKTDPSLMALLHTDAVQAQYQDMHVDRLGVDLMSFSSGKIGGPRGAAALFVRSPESIVGYLGKGSQEFGLFSGTENGWAIAGFAYAFDLARKNFEVRKNKLENLRNYFVSELMKHVPECEINQAVESDRQSPHVVSVSVPSTLSEQLVIELDARGIVCSAKSACESFDGGPSHVIRALYGNARDSWGTVRFSFDDAISKSDIRYVSKTLGEVVKKIHITRSKFS